MQICLADEILVSDNRSLLRTCPLSKVFYAGKGEVKTCQNTHKIETNKMTTPTFLNVQVIKYPKLAGVHHIIF